MIAKGLQKFSLVDYPKKIAAIVFLPNCNFRCPYCYNSSLVLTPESGSDIKEIEILDFLKSRQGKLDALVITGGEPSLHPSLPKFLKKVKNLGFLVKIDTNGTNPSFIEFLLKNKLVDYIAMDIKAPLEKYEKITNVITNIDLIKKTISLIQNSNIDYEFRITLLPKLISEKDILKIAKELKGSKKLCIQQFKPFKGLLDPNLKDAKTYTEKELSHIKDKIKSYFKEIEIRT